MSQVGSREHCDRKGIGVRDGAEGLLRDQIVGGWEAQGVRHNLSKIYFILGRPHNLRHCVLVLVRSEDRHMLRLLKL